MRSSFPRAIYALARLLAEIGTRNTPRTIKKACNESPDEGASMPTKPKALRPALSASADLSSLRRCGTEVGRAIGLTRGRVYCMLPAGHKGAHCMRDPRFMDAGVSQRWRENGVVHRVVWFNWFHSSHKRELWTACGMARDTPNRTKNAKPVTCLRCLTAA